jgi:hypothetical protein
MLTDWITLHTIGASGIGIFKPNSAGMELNLLGEVAVNEEKNDEGTQGGKEKSEQSEQRYCPFLFCYCSS